MTLRFHTQTAFDVDGPTAREQHRANDDSGLAAALGGTQSLHTNASTRHWDPTERAAKLALRTQQVLGL